MKVNLKGLKRQGKKVPKYAHRQLNLLIIDYLTYIHRPHTAGKTGRLLLFILSTSSPWALRYHTCRIEYRIEGGGQEGGRMILLVGS